MKLVNASTSAKTYQRVHFTTLYEILCVLLNSLYEYLPIYLFSQEKYIIFHDNMQVPLKGICKRCDSSNKNYPVNWRFVVFQ